MNTELRVIAILERLLGALKLEDVGEVFLTKLDAQRGLLAVVEEKDEVIREEGLREGYDEGYDEGHRDGWSEGFEEGFEKGKNEVSNGDIHKKVL